LEIFTAKEAHHLNSEPTYVKAYRLENDEGKAKSFPKKAGNEMT